MDEHELTAQLSRARADIEAMRRRIDAIEARTTHLPESMLFDESFLKRAFAVLGHYMVAALIISIPFYALFFLIMIGVGGFGGWW